MELSGLTTRLLGRNFLWLESVDSTNTFLLEHGPQLCCGTAVATSCQTAGRGRMGKQWQGGQEGTLALSVLIGLPFPGEIYPLLPLLSGLAAAQAAGALTGEAFSLKWPNDLLYQEKKLGGILCEARGEGKNLQAVCGIGVNLFQDQGYFDSRGLVYGSSFALSGLPVPEKERWICAFLNHLEENLDRCQREGFASLLPGYTQLCANVGKMVALHTPGGVQTAFCTGVDSQGQLVCQQGERVFSVSAGEVSVRGLYGYV